MSMTMAGSNWLLLWYMILGSFKIIILVGDTDDPGNYHPISVVPIVAKVLEKKLFLPS